MTETQSCYEEVTMPVTDRDWFQSPVIVEAPNLATQEAEPQTRVPDQAAIAQAFSAGSDARIAGWGLADNPYVSTSDNPTRRLYAAWKQGWRHVEAAFGLDSKWATLRLPTPGSRK
jgi:hypothetical protein